MEIRIGAQVAFFTPEDVEKFHRLVQSGHPDGCWEWQGNRYSKARENYGRFMYTHLGNPQQLLAHRVAFALWNGEIHPGRDNLVCHACGNPPCCNPIHLYLGSDKDNMADKDLHGTNPSGEARWRSKLTQEQAMEIKDLYLSCKATRGELAARFGVTGAVISQVAHDRTGYLGADKSVRAREERAPSRLKHITRAAYAELLAEVIAQLVSPSDLAVKYDVPLQYVYNLKYRFRKGLISGE